MKFAKDVKKGDIVNGHEKGLLTVQSVKKNKYNKYNVAVNITYSNGDEREYRDGDQIDVL